jgi:protein-S-isoprenylcysteine O-methyltransferase Ste14
VREKSLQESSSMNVFSESLVVLILFVVVSAGIVRLSWPSLRNPSSHGFYRFFAFETILLLVLFNLPRWFEHPFAAYQVASWLLLIFSLLLALHGFYLLRVIGQPRGDFEQTTRLVIVGAYMYIRHPLYASLLFFTWGVFFKDLTLLGVLLTAVATVALYATAKVEESENVVKFGEEYSIYMKSTRMFIPFLL